MIDKNIVESLVKERLAEIEDGYLVELKISSGNSIHIQIDSLKGVSIDDCVSVSRNVEHNLDRESEDFELEVSSPGLTEPFKVFQQYQKNIGRNVEVNLTDGSKIKGKLESASPEEILVLETRSVKEEGKKKKQNQVFEHKLEMNLIKSTTLVISFK